MKRLLLYILAFLAVCVAWSASQVASMTAPQKPEEEQFADSLRFGEMPDSVSLPVLLPGAPDSIPADSLATDSLATDSIKSRRRARRQHAVSDSAMRSDRQSVSRIKMDRVDLDNTVTFSAKDSLVMIGGNNAYMYGNGTVNYNDMNINAGELKLVMDSSTVYAFGTPDSTGYADNYPVFKDKSGEYESKTMKYNFRTEKGFITDVITEQGEGYLTGGMTKKNADGSFFVQDGKYTTCDDHEHPHFYFQLTKAKVIPKKNIVTGPAYMVLADVPLPIAVPFGYFPFSKDYSSGIIFPSFGEDYNRGFYARDGGYYFAFSDYVDLALRGEIYTKGSWGISGRSNYVKRYRFRGSFDISFITTIYGDKGAPDYSKQKNFRVAWNHSMDTKANPNMSFSASVDFTTSGYTRNDLNSYYNNSFTENTKSSSVNFTYRFPNTKWSFSTTANITQRTQDSTLAVSFPNLTVTMGQLAPFKRKRAAGAERWYEKIRMSYSGQFQNSLTAPQNQFFKKNLLKDWRNGMRHSIPISATFSLFKYFNISPSVSLTDRMYTSKIRRQWDTQASREVMDTTYGFYNIFDFSASISLDTKLYGFFKPWKIFGDKIQMIRHVLTPTFSFSATPDFSAPGWGYYGRYNYVNSQGENVERKYNYFSHGLFGSPSAGRSGAFSMSFNNNLEMKVKSDQDSTGVKKISLIESLNITESYNFAADSLRWSNLNINLLLRLVKNFNLNLNTTWDPYTYQLSPGGSPVRVNRTRLQAGKGLARLSSASTSFSYTFNNATFKRKGKNEDDDENDYLDDDDYDDPLADADEDGVDDFAARAAQKRNKNKKGQDNSADADGYEKWECPWSLTLNYSVSYGYNFSNFNYEKMEYAGKFTQNLSLNGNIRPTKNWNFSASCSYNFDLHKIAYMNCSVSRDIHCFTMTCSLVPVGPYKSFNFHIAVKSSLLKDLKYDKRSSRTNGIQWY